MYSVDDETDLKATRETRFVSREVRGCGQLHETDERAYGAANSIHHLPFARFVFDRPSTESPFQAHRLATRLTKKTAFITSQRQSTLHPSAGSQSV